MYSSLITEQKRCAASPREALKNAPKGIPSVEVYEKVLVQTIKEIEAKILASSEAQAAAKNTNKSKSGTGGGKCAVMFPISLSEEKKCGNCEKVDTNNMICSGCRSGFL